MSELREIPGVQPEKAEKKDRAERFYERWWREYVVTSDAEKKVNEEARLKMRELSAPELTRIGFKQVLYGYALTAIHGVGSALGGALGFVTGGLVGGAAGGVGAALAAAEIPPAAIGIGILGAGIGAVTGSLVGWQLGVEAAGLAYNKYIRKLDRDLPPLETVDWVVGQVPGFNPPIISGIRNIIDGFFGLKNRAPSPAPARA